MRFTGLERYFDTSGRHPAEVVPLRNLCGCDFDARHRLTVVEAEPGMGFVVHAGIDHDRWCMEELLQQMQSQLWWWDRCEDIGPWYMQPESSVPTTPRVAP